jgi:membrane dipeptidase
MVDSQRVREIHAQFPAIDLHADTLMWVHAFGYNMSLRHEPPLPRAAWGGHVDVPRMIEGGLGAQFMGLVSFPALQFSPADAVDEQISLLHALSARDPRVAVARSAGDIERCAETRKVALLLGIEGAHALQGSLERLRYFARRGVRYLGLVHFSSNQAACPAFGFGRDDACGLTSFGRQLVDACEQLGVIVDLAHINRAGFMQVCAMATRPAIVSHGGVWGVHRHWRNIDDDQLRALAATGGAIGIMFAPTFLGASSLGQVVRHVRHVIDVAGQDSVAIGSDWDGMIVPTPGLRDASHLPALTEALLEAGLSEPQVVKVLRGNAMRVLGS